MNIEKETDLGHKKGENKRGFIVSPHSFSSGVGNLCLRHSLLDFSPRI